MAKQIQELSRGAKAAATRAANKLDAAREEVKQIRAQRRADKLAAAQHAATVQPQAQHVNVEDLFAGAGVELPSVARVVVGLILGLTTSFTVGYGIGMLMTYALAGIATLTGSALLAFTLSALVWVLGIYTAWKVSGYVGGKVFASVVLPDGLAAKSYESLANGVSSVKSSVAGWFANKPSVAQFTGAFTHEAA